MIHCTCMVQEDQAPDQKRVVLEEKLQAFTESIGEENSPMHESYFEKAKRFFNL